MTDERIDLSALDPGREPDRVGRIVGAVRALALAGVFLAGLFAGLAVARWGPAAADPGPASESLTRSLDELDLTPEQRERIERILVTSQARTDRVLEETLPRLQAVVDSVGGEIGEVLTEDTLAP